MAEVALPGTTRPKPPQSPSDLPFPAEELQSWAEFLIPAGYQEGLAVAVYGPGNRHLGRRCLGRLMPLVGGVVDPLRSVVAAAEVVRRARARAVIRRNGAVDALPGLPDHQLRRRGSPALAAARAELGGGHVHRSFLWPLGRRHAPAGHARVTVLARAQDRPVRIPGIVLVSDPGDLRGLTARELEVLGLVVEGCSNRQTARTLIIAQRTVAAHMEHVLAKLAAATRTAAAVRAERAGLYVPPRAGERRPP